MTSEQAIQLLRDTHPEAVAIREWDGGFRVRIQFQGEREIDCPLSLPHHSESDLRRWITNELPRLRQDAKAAATP
jgi:hypothetical protein